MLCQDCLTQVMKKLHPEDLVLLEYLEEKGANSPQFTFTNDSIRAGTNLTAHQAYTAILRLECYDLIGVQKWGRSNKYYITEAGCEALKLFRAKAEQKEA